MEVNSGQNRGTQSAQQLVSEHSCREDRPASLYHTYIHFQKTQRFDLENTSQTPPRLLTMA